MYRESETVVRLVVGFALIMMLTGIGLVAVTLFQGG